MLKTFPALMAQVVEARPGASLGVQASAGNLSKQSC